MTGFAERLNYLFEFCYPPGRGSFRSSEVVQALSGSEYPLSAPYISQLRSGNRVKPSATTVRRLADFFRVDSRYFTDELYFRRIKAELALHDALRDKHVRRIVTATFGLSQSAIEELARTIDDLRSDILISDSGKSEMTIAPKPLPPSDRIAVGRLPQ